MNERSNGLFSESKVNGSRVAMDITSMERHRGGVTTARGRINNQETIFTVRRTPKGDGTVTRAVTPQLDLRGNLTGFDVRIVEIRRS